MTELLYSFTLQVPSTTNSFFPMNMRGKYLKQGGSKLEFVDEAESGDVFELTKRISDNMLHIEANGEIISELGRLLDGEEFKYDSVSGFFSVDHKWYLTFENNGVQFKINMYKLKVNLVENCLRYVTK